jgi:hypothetical protein
MPLVIVFLFLLLNIDLVQGGENPGFGGRSSALGNAGVTLIDVWSVNNNQACLSHLRKPIVAFSFENRFLIKQLSVKEGAFALPTNYGVWALSFSSFGYVLFSESKVGMAYSKKLGERLSAGIKFNYMELKIADNYGKSNSIRGEIGLFAKLSNHLNLGVHINNPSVTKNNSNLPFYPTIMRLGMDYSFSSKTLLILETQKSMEQKPVFKVGIEYRPVQQLYLRTGIASNPAFNSFGIGLLMEQLTIDLAATYSTTLGTSPKISLIYSF